MNEQDLERLLYQSADHLPPESVEQKPPTPWRQALLTICWGIVLITIHFSSLGIHCILAAGGTVLLYLGFRALRRENSWFRLGYTLSILILAAQFAIDILLATPLTEWLNNGGSVLLGLATGLVTWLLLFALWQGLKEVFLHAGQPPQTRAAGGLVACYTLFIFLALLEVSGLPALAFITVWAVMIWWLFKISHALDQAGYAIQPAPVRLSNRKVLLVSLGALLLAVLACLLLFSRYPVETAPAQPETGHAELRQELLDLGFPEELLADLPDAEVALLDGAVAVHGERHNNVNTYPWNDPDAMSGLSAQTVQVVLPGGSARYYYSFSWDHAPLSRFKESIGVMPGAQFSNLNSNPVSPNYHLAPPQGRLLWEHGGQTMSASLASGGLTPLTTQSLFGVSQYQCYAVDFSLPIQGDHIRGYLAWTLAEMPIDVILTARVIYTRQTSPLQYPWIDAIQNFSGNTPFYQTRMDVPNFFQFMDADTGAGSA